MYKLVYKNPYLHDPLVWSNLDRKNTIRQACEVMDAFRDEGCITIKSNASERYFIRYYLGEAEFDIHRHANGYHSTIYGRSFKTIVGALNKLDKLAATDRH